MLKTVKLQGLHIGANGALVPVEMKGPTDFTSWTKCYALFRTAAISFDCLTPSTCDNYKKKIGNYIERYGDNCWAIIYQADVRTRLEQAERTKRRLLSEKVKADSLGKVHDYDPSKPWEGVYAELIKESDWWREQLEDPCMLLISKVKRQNDFVEGDASVSGHQETRKRTTTAEQSSPGKSPKKVKNAHNVTDNAFTTNRDNLRICPGFQDGSCSGTDRNGRCRADGVSTHQCAKCLRNDHGASTCDRTPQPPRGPKGKDKGGGKGKGKGKGKGQW
jgi:hypothetical protein